MKTLGIIGVVAGQLMVGIGIVFLFLVGVVALVPVLIGLIAILCGAICFMLSHVDERLATLQKQISRIGNDVRAQQPSTAEAAAEQAVDQLRQEGFLRTGEGAVDDQSVNDLVE